MAFPHGGCREASVKPLQGIASQRAVRFVFLEIASSHFLCSLLVFADQDAGIGEIHVRRNFEVGRGRLRLEYASGKVEGRTMAGAEASAQPVTGHSFYGTIIEILERQAAKGRTDDNDH